MIDLLNDESIYFFNQTNLLFPLEPFIYYFTSIVRRDGIIMILLNKISKFYGIKWIKRGGIKNY